MSPAAGGVAPIGVGAASAGAAAGVGAGCGGAAADPDDDALVVVAGGEVAARVSGGGAGGRSLMGSIRWNVCGSFTSCCATGGGRRGVSGAGQAEASWSIQHASSRASGSGGVRWEAGGGAWRGTWRSTSAVCVLSCSSRPAKIRRCVEGAGCSGWACCSASLIRRTVPRRGTLRRRSAASVMEGDLTTSSTCVGRGGVTSAISAAHPQQGERRQQAAALVGRRL